MTDKMFAHLKLFVSSVNAITSSPYEVSIRPLRDDDGIHAVVTYDCINRFADNIFECLRFHPMVYDYIKNGRQTKMYFK